MIELNSPVRSEELEDFDQQLLELGDARWMLLQDLPSAQTKLIGVFSDRASASEAWETLCSHLHDISLPEFPTSRTLVDQDWRDSYKAHFKSWHFGSLHWVPVWERAKYKVAPGERVIWLDPGLAFGTGNHETTRLCCERLVSLTSEFGPAASVVDAGCGSGILALSAARLGYTDVIGFDNDPEAIAVSRENAVMNELENAVRFFEGDLISGLAGRTASVVLANIQADVLIRFADQLIASLRSPGALILSGILAVEVDGVRRIFEGKTGGWKVESRVMNEWADLMLIRP